MKRALADRSPKPDGGRQASVDALQIRRRGLVGQDADGFLDRDQGLGLGAQAADSDHALLGFLTADHGDDRHLADGVFADLVADLLVPQVDLGAQAGGLNRAMTSRA